MKQIIITIAALMTLLSCGGQKEKEVTNKNNLNPAGLSFGRFK